MAEYYAKRDDPPAAQNSAGTWEPVVSAGGVAGTYGPITTTDNTAQLVHAVHLGVNQTVLLTAEYNCWRDDFSNGGGGSVMGLFLRGAGNVFRSGAQSKRTIGGLSVALDLVEDTVTQAANVVIRGEGAQTDVWLVRLYVYPCPNAA